MNETGDKMHQRVFHTVDRYRKDECLGTGGLGEVFAGWDRLMKRRVALKRLRRSVATKPKARARFQREAEWARGFDHPHLVRCLDWVRQGEDEWMVMEFVPGQTLRQRMTQDPMDWQEVVEVVLQITEGLQALHSEELLHRDLKAENIMLTPEGRVRLLDFGLTCRWTAASEESSDKNLCGTVSAMSPEQILGGPLDSRSDLFALGILLYELVTGRAPFRTPDTRLTLTRILTELPPPVHTLRPDAPAVLCALIDQLLHKEPCRRPRDAAEVTRRLESLGEEGGEDTEAIESFRLLVGDEEVTQTCPTVWFAASGRVEAEQGAPQAC